MTYLAQRLNIIKETTNVEQWFSQNAAFYTSDGMRFEFPSSRTNAGSSEKMVKDVVLLLMIKEMLLVQPQNCLVCG